MSKRVIVIDIDGVLADFNTPFAELLTRFGAVMTPFEGVDPRLWHWFEAYGATPAQAEAAWAYAEQTSAWWSWLPPHRDFTRETRATLSDLTDQFIDQSEVYFVTSRPKGVRGVTARWLSKHLHNITPQVIVTPTNKVAALMALDADVVIEDRRETLMDFAVVKPTAQLILLDRAYNQGVAPITRVASLTEALELL